MIILELGVVATIILLVLKSVTPDVRPLSASGVLEISNIKVIKWGGKKEKKSEFFRKLDQLPSDSINLRARTGKILRQDSRKKKNVQIIKIMSFGLLNPPLAHK